MPPAAMDVTTINGVAVIAGGKERSEQIHAPVQRGSILASISSNRSPLLPWPLTVRRPSLLCQVSQRHPTEASRSSRTTSCGTAPKIFEPYKHSSTRMASSLPKVVQARRATRHPSSASKPTARLSNFKRAKGCRKPTTSVPSPEPRSDQQPPSNSERGIPPHHFHTSPPMTFFLRRTISILLKWWNCQATSDLVLDCLAPFGEVRRDSIRRISTQSRRMQTHGERHAR
jgi:hypothetical protein